MLFFIVECIDNFQNKLGRMRKCQHPLTQGVHGMRNLCQSAEKSLRSKGMEVSKQQEKEEPMIVTVEPINGVSEAKGEDMEEDNPDSAEGVGDESVSVTTIFPAPLPGALAMELI